MSLSDDPEEQQSDKAAIQIAQGQAVMEADARVARQQAKQFPRDERKILKDSLAELELVPESAEKAYYSIPFVDRKAGKTTLVQGLSIGSALGLARRWGNCATTVRCLNEDPSGWDLEGVFIDFETNFHCGRPIRGSKLLKTKSGQVYTLDERRASMAFGAHASKAQRNAVLAALPNYLKEAYFAKARQIVGGAPDAPAEPKRVEACIKAFGRWNVTEEQLVKYINADKSKWTGEDVANLRGLWAAINDDNISVQDAFQTKPVEVEAQDGSGLMPAKRQPGDSAVLTPESLGTTATVTAENDPKDRGGKPAEAAQDAPKTTPEPPKEAKAEPPAAPLTAAQKATLKPKEVAKEANDPDADVRKLFGE